MSPDAEIEWNATKEGLIAAFTLLVVVVLLALAGGTFLVIVLS